jgi:uncharacterized membrane protein YjdF
MNQELTTKQKNVRNILYLVMFSLLILKYSNLTSSYLTWLVEISSLIVIFLVAKKNNIINKSSFLFYLIIVIVFITLFIFRNSPFEK